MNLLFRIPEVVPTDRADVAVLFGSHLSRQGITCDLVALTEGAAPRQVGCGLAFTLARGRGRFGNVLRKLCLDLALIPLARCKHYDAIQVRDCVWGGLAGLIAGRLFSKPVYYWVSYLVWEGAEARAREGGVRQGVMRWWYSRMRDSLNGIVFRKLLLSRFDHVFVQSEAMRSLFVGYGSDLDRMTVVPMGVDLEAIERTLALPIRSATRPENGPMLAYLGILAKERRINFLIDVLGRVRESYPTAKLVLIGDAIEAEDRQEIERYAACSSLAAAVEITGWLKQEDAWGILAKASVALSALPRSVIFDVSFPTKVVEYLALGLPIVVNDIPAQAEIVERSAAGRCVPMEVGAFSTAVVELLGNEALRRRMGESGRAFVRETLEYRGLARPLAITYLNLQAKGRAVA